MVHEPEISNLIEFNIEDFLRSTIWEIILGSINFHCRNIFDKDIKYILEFYFKIKHFWAFMVH
jgi:hypothetical protein